MRFHPPSVPRRRRSKPALATCLLWASAGLAHAVPGPSQGSAHHRAHAPAHSPAHGSAQARQIQHAQQALQAMSVPFEANSGQFDPAVAFTGRTFAGAIHVTRQGQIVYSLAAPAQQQGVTSVPLPETPPQKPPKTPAGTKPQAPPQTPPPPQRLSGWSLTETLVGALPLSPTGGEAAATQITRFSGPHRYQPATYRNLHLGQAWPGVQVELAVRGANVEKLFHVAPQADASQIQVRVDGALSLRLGEGGELIAATGHGDVAYTAPVAFQKVAGQRVDVPVQYALNSQGDSYGFALRAYDRALPLVIDPLLQSTYLGGDGSGMVTALVIAPSGEVVVGGLTSGNSSLGTFPGTAGGAQPATGGAENDGFIARLSADLRTLEQSTYLGGTGLNYVAALAISPSGEVLVAGNTSSTVFPGTANGAQSVAAGGYDGFIARLSADLRTLEQSTYLGGTQFEDLRAMAIAPSGEVLVAGDTSSTDFPGTADGAQSAAAGGLYDGFIARLSADLQTLEQSTYLGGSGLNYVTALAISSSGEVLAAGSTSSTDFPGTAGGAQSVAAGGGSEGFIARLSADLRTLAQSTYLSGAGYNVVHALTLAPSGDVLAGGYTTAIHFPGTAGGAQSVAAGGDSEGFIARLSADLRTLAQSTYLSGAGYNVVQALTIAPSGDVLAGGFTDAIHFPGMAGGAQSVAAGGGSEGFIARLSADLRTLVQSTYLGGSGVEAISTLAMAPSGEVLVGGLTYSRDFPGTAGGAQPGANISGVTGFIARLSDDLRAVSPQAITFPPQADQVLAAPGATFQIIPIATANSGLAVNYTAHTPGICTVSDTTVTMVDAGPCMLEAWLPSVPGQWLAANGIFVTLQIRRPQVITFPAQADQPFTAGASFDLGPPATASSGLPVGYASATPDICTVSGNTVTMVSVGTCTVTAHQPGDTLWLAAASVTREIELRPSAPPVAPGPVPVPALGPWLVALLGALAAGLGATGLRRRRRPR